MYSTCRMFFFFYYPFWVKGRNSKQSFLIAPSSQPCFPSFLRVIQPFPSSGKDYIQYFQQVLILPRGLLPQDMSTLTAKHLEGILTRCLNHLNWPHLKQLHSGLFLDKWVLLPNRKGKPGPSEGAHFSSLHSESHSFCSWRKVKVGT